MAASKKKRIKQVEEPRGNNIGQGGNPDQYYLQQPSWSFANCDMEQWSIFSKDIREIFWDEILPRLQSWETQTWGEVLVKGKKQNHSINVKALNKAAVIRLVELYIEAESIISLSLTATHRIYGYMQGAVFHILWVDLNHGDNAACVCRSKKKNT